MTCTTASTAVALERDRTRRTGRFERLPRRLHGRREAGYRQPAEPVALAAFTLITGDLADNPHRVGKGLSAPLEGLHSARRGDYRNLYRIGEGVITILDVKRRRDAYRS